MNATPTAGGQRLQSRARRIAADTALTALVVFTWLRGLGRRRRVRRDRKQRQLDAGEVIVAYPAQLWEDWRAEALEDALKLVARRLHRWQVVERGRQAITRKHLTALSGAYIRLLTRQGVEDDVVRAVNVALWRFRLPRGRRGVLVVRAPVIEEAAAAVQSGALEPTLAYQAAKARLRADGRSAAGVKILIVERGRPEQLPQGADITILEPTDEDVVSKHATLVTSIVADIARDATISVRSIGDKRDESAFWALLAVLTEEHDADLIIASLSAPEGGDSKDGRGRDSVFESALRGRTPIPAHPPIFSPTGNHRGKRSRIDTIAIPARFDSVIAIGACNEDGRLPRSRYGSKKTDGDPSTWWLAPGASLMGPFFRIGDKAHEGTSIANAIAGALAAIAIREARNAAPATPERFDDTVEGVKDGLGTQTGADSAIAMADGYKAIHSQGKFDLQRLVGELDRMAHRFEPDHDEQQHGHGLLRLRTADDDARAPAPAATTRLSRLIPPN
jgi:hypothetical protein